MRLPSPPPTVVSVLPGCCNAGSLSATGSPEPGGDKAAGLASILVELVFSSVVLIVVLDHVGRVAGVWCGCARVPVHTKIKKGFYRKGIRKNQRTRRTKNNKESPRVGLNLSYRITTKRHRAILSDHSDTSVLL